MRNLKRALSLALATLMVLSMMVVGAGAVSIGEFSDNEKIANKEAVTVLTTLGVINGKDDGSYDPEGIVTRAEMAKMICVILNGGKNPQLGETLKNSYTDTANTWAASYIEYCTTLGIVSGRGDGTFDPNGTVTVAEAGKMILVALGYNAGVEGYTGANWQINTDVRANELDLYDGLGTLNTNIDLTRDNAAQMLYNALDVHMVVYDYIITGTAENAITTKPQLNDTDKGTLLWEKFGAVKVVGVVEANEFANLNSGKTDTDKAPKDVVIGASLDEGKTQVIVTNSGDDQKVYANREYTFSVSTGEEELGKAVYMYVKPANNSSSSLKATVLGSAIISDENVIVADASGDKAADVADDNNLDLTADTKYVYNYASMGSKAPADKDGKTGIQKTLVDVDADGDADYVLYKEMGLGKVTLYTEAKDGQVVVAINGGNLVNKDKADIIGFEDVAKDDYVLSAYFGGRLYVQKAETVTGTIEAYKQTKDAAYTNGYRNTGFTVDGTNYTVSRVGTYNGDVTPAVVGTDKTILQSDATFYLDLNGYVVAYGEVDESAYKYAYIWGGEAGKTNLASDRVKATLEDGTTKTYTLSGNSDIDLVGDAKANDDLHYVKGNSYTLGENKISGLVFAYSLTSSGEIKLTLPRNGAVKSAEDSTFTFTKGLTAIKFSETAEVEKNLKPSDVTLTPGQVSYSNNATTFFYVTMKKSDSTEVDKVEVYNGRNNAPSVKDTDGTALLAFNSKGTVASAVFTGVKVTESADNHVFITNANYVWSDYGYVNAIFNKSTAVEKDVKVAYVDELGGEIEHNPTVTDGIYLYSKNSDGYYEITDPGHDYKTLGDADRKSYYFEGTVGRVNKATNTFVLTVDGKETGAFIEEFQLTNNSIVLDYDSDDSEPVAVQGSTVAEGDVLQIIVNNSDDCEVLMAAIMDRKDNTNSGGNTPDYSVDGVKAGPLSTVAEVNALLKEGNVVIEGTWTPAKKDTLSIPANATLKIQGDFDAPTYVDNVNALSSSNLVVTGTYTTDGNVNYKLTAKDVVIRTYKGADAKTVAISNTVTVGNDLEVRGDGSVTIAEGVTVTVNNDVTKPGTGDTVKINVDGTLTVTGNEAADVVVRSTNSLHVGKTMSGKLTVGDAKNEGRAVVGTMTGDVVVTNGSLEITEEISSSSITGSKGAVITFASGAEATGSAAGKFTAANGATVTDVAGLEFTFGESDEIVNDEVKVPTITATINFVYDQKSFNAAEVPTSWLAFDDKTGNAVWDLESYKTELAAHPYVYVTATKADGVDLDKVKITEVKINGKVVTMSWATGDNAGENTFGEGATLTRWGFDILTRDAENISKTSATSVKAGDKFEITLTWGDPAETLTVTGIYDGPTLPEA